MAVITRANHNHNATHNHHYHGNDNVWRMVRCMVTAGIVLLSLISLRHIHDGAEEAVPTRRTSRVDSIRKTIHLDQHAAKRPATIQPTKEKPKDNDVNQATQQVQQTKTNKKGQKTDKIPQPPPQETEEEEGDEQDEEFDDDDDSTAVNRREQRRRRQRPPGCLTFRCIKELGHSLASPYEEHTDKSQWCRSKTNDDHVQRNHNNSTSKNSKFEQGLLLVKVPKSASSTMAGVTLRIANRHSCDQVQWQHRPGTTYANRDPDKSFLLTSVRSPMTRVLSYIFFMDLSIQGTNGGVATDEFMLERLQNFHGRYGNIRDGQGGFTMQFASLDEIPNYSAWSPENRTVVQNPKDVIARVSQVLDDYDFIVVVERMDESLVALALLLGLDVADVLVTSSKVAGGNQYFWDAPAGRCVNLTKSFASKAVKEYFTSDDWKAQNYGDYLLHAAASASLDKTILELGNKRFQTALAKFRRLQQMEQQVCAPHVQFPCSNTGAPQPKLARKQCYQRDFGCGYPCIDDMVARGVGFAQKEIVGPNGTPVQITTYGRNQ